MGISLEEKARNYLAEGRVILYSVDSWYASAVVTGSKPYQVILRGKSDSQASCQCPGWSYNTKCAHVVAVRMITDLADMPHERPSLPVSANAEFDRILGIVADVRDGEVRNNE